MKELKINPNFTIEDIHKIREYHYEGLFPRLISRLFTSSINFNVATNGTISYLPSLEKSSFTGFGICHLIKDFRNASQKSCELSISLFPSSVIFTMPLSISAKPNFVKGFIDCRPRLQNLYIS